MAETFEEANQRVLREINIARIEQGLSPLKLDLETGEGLEQAMAAFREANMPKQERPDPRDVRQESSEETVRRLLNLLTGIGQIGDIGLGEGGEGQVLLDQLNARAAQMRGSGAAVGIGDGPAQLPSVIPDQVEQTPVQVLQEFARQNQGFAGQGPSSIPSQGSSGNFDPEALILLLTALASQSGAEGA